MIYGEGLTEEKATSMMKLAGFQIKNTFELVNQYWGSGREKSPTGSWWLFETPFGLIRLGCRKRVMEIVWTATGKKIDLACPENEKSNTRWETGVHVYDIPTAIRDLTELHRQLAMLAQSGMK